MKAIVLAGLLLAACGREREAAPPEIPVGNGKMQLLAPGVFAEPGLSEADHRTLLQAHATAAAKVKEYFGEPHKGLPLALFCHSAMCKVTFGAPPAAAASPDLGFARDGFVNPKGFVTTPVVVATGPVPNTALILTHELVHAEMKAWVPYDALPTWFMEGIATFIADEPNCSAASAVSVFDVRQLDTKEKWQAHLRTGRVTLSTYCHARNEAARWAGKFGDKTSAGSAIRAVCQAVARGESFDQLTSQ